MTDSIRQARDDAYTECWLALDEFKEALSRLTHAQAVLRQTIAQYDRAREEEVTP